MEDKENILDLFKQIEEDRAKRSALPVDERNRINREEGIRELLDFGYINEEEAEQYRQKLTALPTDRKGLVVAYFLLGYYDYDIVTPNESHDLREFLNNFRLWERGYRPNEALSDRLTQEEGKLFKNGLRDLRTKGAIERAETFVDSKRRRLRDLLFRPLRARVAVALSFPPEKENGETLDSNPYVRDVAIENGYRPRAKSINDTDRQAIETASLYYLDLIEYALLSGEYDRRREEVYPKYLSEDKKEWDDTFYYEDELDEVITSTGDIIHLFNVVLEHFYNDGSAKDMIDFAKGSLSGYLTYKEGIVSTDKIEEDLVKGRILNTKFSYLIYEDLC